MQKWDLILNGVVVDSIEADSLALNEGFLVFYVGTDRTAITALGAGTVLRPAPGQEATYINQNFGLMEPPSRFDSDD